MANVNVEKDLREIKEAYVRLAEYVERLEKSLDAIISAKASKANTKQNNKSKAKVAANSKLIEIKKLQLNGKEVDVHVYKNFVVVDNHKRKIYEFKKGRMFSYEGKNVYLQLNTPQAI